MSDNTNNDPFDLGEPQGATGKHRFGELMLIVNKVKYVKGASYTVNGLTNKDGEPIAFRGKELSSAPDALRHIVLVLECEKQDGEKYNTFAHFMNNKKEDEYKATMPTLVKHFGEKLAGLSGKKVSVEIEEVEFPNGDYAAKRAWKVVKVFANSAERKAASEAYFSAFRSGGDANGEADLQNAQATEAKGPGAWSAEDWRGIASDVKASYAKALAAQTGPEQLKARKALDVVAKEYEVTPDDVKAVVV